MWRPSQTAICWIPSALALVLLAACSQVSAPRSQVADAPSPIAAQPEAFPTPSPTPTPSSTPSATSGAQTKPSIAPAPAKAPTAAIAPPTPTKPLPLEQKPTFQTTPRMAGFSPDGNYFIYLESSRDAGAGVPKSVLQLVDVASNQCVANGCIETRYGEKAAGTKTAEAEADLLKQTWKVRQDLKLTPPVEGRELPIIARSRAVDGSETVTIRMDNERQSLQLHLRQKSAAAKAAMQLDVTYNGQQRSLDSLDHFRNYVLDYSIRQVKRSPDGKRIAVLITATKPTFEGTLGTTLVQGFQL